MKIGIIRESLDSIHQVRASLEGLTSLFNDAHSQQFNHIGMLLMLVINELEKAIVQLDRQIYKSQTQGLNNDPL